ncbi:MAG: AsmA-like C-terminal region-containing protein, partial [Bacteroidota bacterium]
MNRKKKILLSIASIVALLLIMIVALPFLFKGKIIEAVKKGANENVNAQVNFTDVGVTLFRHFPHLTISIDSVSIVGRDTFAGDTLLQVGRMVATVDLMSILSGDQIRIRSIYLNTPTINLIVLEDGKANWDIAIPDTTQAPAASGTGMKIQLKRYGIKNGNITYDDRSLGFYLKMANVVHKGRGDFSDDFFSFSTSTDVESLDMAYGGVKYLSKTKTSLKADLDMDMKAMKFTFKDNEIKVNELVMGLTGYVAMPNDPIEMDLKFDIRKNDFSNFVSLIPGAYKTDFDKAKSSGTLALSGYLKGVYSETTMPGFSLDLKIDKGQFSYPNLPVALNNVTVNLSVKNPDGVPDNTIIDLSSMHLEVGKDPFDIRLLVKTPVSDPQIDGSVKGRLDLGAVARMFPLEKDTRLAGVLEADVAASGRMSAIENQRYQYFRAEGMMRLKGFSYASNEFKSGVEISNAELVFNPKNVTLNQLAMKTGKTSLTATGWIDNLMGYVFKENQLLTGTLDVNANLVDLNEYMSTSTDTSTATASTGVFEVPGNIDFTLTAKAGQVFMQKHVLSNAVASLNVRDRAIIINKFAFGLLDGTVGMSGTYDSKDLKKPAFQFNLDVAGMDIKKTFQAFESVKKLAPVAEQCSGKYGAVFNIKGEMDQKMEPVYNSLTGGGKLQTSGLTVDNFKPLVKLADMIKMDQFKSFSPENLNISFRFENGRVQVEPFPLNMAGIKSTVSGSNGFDQSIDYNIVSAIPLQIAGLQASDAINSLLAKANQATGANMSIGREAKVNAHITGTVKDPKVNVSFGSGSAAGTPTVKEQVKEVIDAKVKELEEKAKAEADRLKKEAEAKAKAEAERLKKEAEAKAKAEADRLKKELEQKAKKEAEDK